MKYHKEKDFEQDFRRCIIKQFKNCFLFPKLDTPQMALPDIIFIDTDLGGVVALELKLIKGNHSTVNITPLFCRQLRVLKLMAPQVKYAGVVTNIMFEGKITDEILKQSVYVREHYYEKIFSKTKG